MKNLDINSDQLRLIRSCLLDAMVVQTDPKKRESIVEIMHIITERINNEMSYRYNWRQTRSMKQDEKKRI